MHRAARVEGAAVDGQPLAHLLGDTVRGRGTVIGVGRS